MQRVVKLSLILLALVLPVQTLLVQILTNRFGWPYWVSLWKEGLVLLIIISSLLFIFGKFIPNQESFWDRIKKIWPLIAIDFATGLVLIVSLVNRSPIGNALVGFRFELFWLWLFASVVSAINIMDSAERKKLIEFASKFHKYIWLGFVPVVIVTIIGFLIGQDKVLEFFGFGANNSELIVQAPLAHVIDGGGFNESIRLSGGFSTPNHFAGYLLFLLGISLGNLFGNTNRKKWLAVSVGILILIVLSFARFSWLGAAMMIGGLAILQLTKKYQVKKSVRKILVGVTILIPALIGLVAINLPYENLVNDLPSWIAKPSSTSLHRMHTMTSIDVLREDPSKIAFGYGLGVSGPAAKEIYNSLYDNPLVEQYSFIPYRWDLVEKDLLIPENWFLQVLINGGVFYLILYLMIVLLPVKKLFDELNSKKIDYLGVSILLSMIAIVIGNLFLHIWENQTIAIYWTLVWVVYSSSKRLTKAEK